MEALIPEIGVCRYAEEELVRARKELKATGRPVRLAPMAAGAEDTPTFLGRLRPRKFRSFTTEERSGPIGKTALTQESPTQAREISLR